MKYPGRLLLEVGTQVKETTREIVRRQQTTSRLISIGIERDRRGLVKPHYQFSVLSYTFGFVSVAAW